MRILHVNTEKTWRGGERQTLLLAAALPALGASVAVGCREGFFLAREARAQALPCIPIAGGSVRALWELARQARTFDLVHCHTARAHSLAAVAAAWHRKPVVVTRRVDFRPKQSVFNRFKYRRASRVVCISEFIARQLRDWGVPRDRLVVIRSAIPAVASEKTGPERAEELRTRLGIGAGKKLVGNIAALVGHKDHATLLRSAREVLARRQDVAFVIIGDGELKAELLRLRSELSLVDAVHFAGFIAGAERYLPAFDVLVMSSCMEGLGSIVLDAFAAGVPVAATAGGGLPELVRPDRTGLLVPIGDAAALAASIVRLLDDPPLRQTLTATARDWVSKECGVQQMAIRYFQLYQEVLSTR